MKWVLDNTVMSNFSLIHGVEWLVQLGERDFVTVEEAWQELQQGVKKKLLSDVDWGWLQVEKLTDIEKKRMLDLMPPLDLGEAACLSLAQHRRYGILTDDRLPRRYARLLRIPLSGTLGLLKLLVDFDHLSMTEADEALARLIVLGYRSPINSLRELF